MHSVNITIFGDMFSGKTSLLRNLISKPQDEELKREFYSIPPRDPQKNITFNIFDSQNYLKKMTRVAEKMFMSDILICTLSFSEKENDFMAQNFPKTNEQEIKLKKKLYNSVIQILIQFCLFFGFIPNLIFVITKCENEVLDTLNNKIVFFKNKLNVYLTGLGVKLSENSIIATSSLLDNNILTKSSSFSADCTLYEAIMQKAILIRSSRESNIQQHYKPTRFSVINSYKKLGIGMLAEGFNLGNELRINDQVLILPANKKSEISSIEFYGKEVDSTHSDGAFGISLKGLGSGDLPRGSMICKVGHNCPDTIELNFAIVHLWFVYAFNFINRGFVMTFVGFNTRVPVIIDDILETLDFETVTNEWEYGNSVIGTLLVAKIKFLKPLFVERFEENPTLGRFSLVGSNIVYAMGQIESLNSR